MLQHAESENFCFKSCREHIIEGLFSEAAPASNQFFLRTIWNIQESTLVLPPAWAFLCVDRVEAR